MKLQDSSFHFIGIGGIGMCGLAKLLFNMGAHVSGSDLKHSEQTERLRKLGISISFQHKKENIKNPNVVVYSSAISLNNVEVKEARKKSIPIIPRAEALAEIMRLKKGIAIGGTHGKTTTTSLVSSIFLYAGLEPTILVGGKLNTIQATSKLGNGQWFIAEADESDGSFLHLSPEIVVITNIDNDHMDYFKNLNNLQKNFFNFAQKIPFYGAAIIYGDDKNIRKIFNKFPKKIIYYGFNKNNNFILTKQKNFYQISLQKKIIGNFSLNINGDHNALNALAAIIVGLQAGINFKICQKGINNYKGVARRFEYKGSKNNILVYDDYAHHPTEIKATLKAFKEKFPNKKITAIFQPHRYSRTKICFNDFFNCFSNCHQLILTDIYAAGEKKIKGIDSQTLLKKIKHNNCNYVSYKNILKYLHQNVTSFELIVTLGAGNIWKISEEFIKN